MVTVKRLGVGMTRKDLDFLGCWKSVIGTRRQWFVLSQSIRVNSRYLCPAICIHTNSYNSEEKIVGSVLAFNFSVLVRLFKISPLSENSDLTSNLEVEYGSR